MFVYNLIAIGFVFLLLLGLCYMQYDGDDNHSKERNKPVYVYYMTLNENMYCLKLYEDDIIVYKFSDINKDYQLVSDKKESNYVKDYYNKYIV